MIKVLVKSFLKKYFKYFFIKDKLGSCVQIQQRALFLKYQNDTKLSTIPLESTGFKNFSQFEEDGLLLFIFSVIGMESKVFVEIGSDDGINSNCSNLYFHFGWHGLFIDGNQRAINRGKYFYSKYPNPYYYKPYFECSMVTINNINDIIRKHEIEGEIGLLSIDIDGNDYWIWDAIEIISPNVVVIETHNEFGYNNIVVPYDEDGTLSNKHPIYHGASPVAMKKLGEKKGYKLIGSNQLGFNFIFLKKEKDLNNYFPEKSISDLLKHPSAIKSFKKFDPIKSWDYVTPIE